jgi:hypothetical protein
MKRVEEFNNRLNSTKIYTKEHEIYVNRVDSIIRPFLNTIMTNRLLVIGAGNLRDFKVETFLDLFNEIHLSDVDEQSVYKGLLDYQLSNDDKKKIEVKKLEYTGVFSDLSWDALTNKLRSCVSEKEVEQVLTPLFQKMQIFDFSKDLMSGYDAIYVSPIYTQLVMNQFISTFDFLLSVGMSEQIATYGKAFVLDQMPMIIDRFNRTIVSLLNNMGILMVASDVFEVKKTSQWDQTISTSNNIDVTIEQLYQEYLQEYGMGLGDYGLYNLDEYVEEMFKKWLIWPNTETSYYIVKFKIYKQKGGIL